jgi:hypothetical protein
MVFVMTQCPTCGGHPCVNPSFCQLCRKADAKKRDRVPGVMVTIEAVVLSVQEHGIGALKDASNIERLSRCNRAAKNAINRRIEKLGLKP